MSNRPMTPSLSLSRLRAILKRDLPGGLPGGPSPIPALTILALAPIALCSALLWVRPAKAEDPAPLPPAPGVQSIGFIDADPGHNCPVDEAVKGQCVERVWLYMPQDDLRYPDLIRCPEGDPACPESGRKWARDDGTREAASKNISDSYAQLWDVLARRWSRDGDVPQATLFAAGYTGLPTASDQWEMQQKERLRVALPEMDSWYRPDMFAIPDPENKLPTTGGVFDMVSYRLPALDGSGTRPGPQMTLMQGRFALRMGYEGRRYDYNIMDADPGYSGPFYEQFFPFHAARDEERPLHSFNRSVQSDPLYRAPSLLTTEASYQGLQDLAVNLFDEFVLQTGTAVARFAMREYTLNQLRSLAAITLMRNARFGADLGGSRDLVAAARSQTDAEDAIAERLSRSELSLSRNFHVNPARLPDDVIVASIRRWVLRYKADEGFYLGWSRVVMDKINLGVTPGDVTRREFAEVLRKEVMQPSSGALRAWLRANLATDGVVPTDTVSAIWRIGLVETLQRSPRAYQEETRLLLDHVQYGILRTIDVSGKKSTPNEIAKIAGDQWQNVLSAHSESTRLIEQGLGAVDPNSICTVQDGRAALDEASIGMIHVDMIVEGRDPKEKEKAMTAGELLWENRENIPFLLLDDPSYTVPQVTRIVGLPDGRAIWRVRWQAWSGWHLLWTLEPGDAEHVRMTARTTTFCDDIVMAEPRLVPTLVRASLLSGTFQPTRPRLRSDGPLPKKEKEAPDGDADAAIENVTGGAEAAKGKTEEAKGQVTAIQEGGVSTDTVGGLAGAIKGGDGGETAAILEEEVSEEARYLRDIVHAPLWRKAGLMQGMLLFVFDHSPDDERPHDLEPRTPYLRITRAAPDIGEENRLRTSAWAWFWTPAPSPDPLLVAPAWRPVHGDEEVTIKPGWRQVDSNDPHLVVGALTFPWRQIRWTCDTEPTDYDVVSDCSGPDTVSASGMGIDLLGGLTFWLGDRPQVAIDSDIEAHLEMLPPGLGIFDESNTTNYAWMFEPQFGLSLGFRWAPLPPGLATRFGWPWGAERRDGHNRLVRSQIGTRVGLLAGPGINGIETTFYTELWGGLSIRSARTKFATLTPYHPRMWLSPFARLSYSWLPIPPTETFHLTLQNRTSLAVGLRLEMLLTAPPTIPEGG